MSSAAAPPSEEIRNYLLRRMTETARTRFEAAYFADDALLDRVESEEDLLVSDYVLGKLTESDRRLFEGSLLGTPYYKDRVETTSRLKQRLSMHSAFDRRSRPSNAPVSPSATPRRRAEDRPSAARRAEERLFPGRTGVVVGFALLGLLLLASLASALRLRSELDKARTQIAVVRRARISTPGGAAGVVPIAETLVFETGQHSGPDFRHVIRAAGSPLLFVFPSRMLPPTLRRWGVSLSNELGQEVWSSGRHERTEGDLAVRLPPGVPPAGRYSVVLHAESEQGASDLSCGVLELAPLPAPHP